MLKNTFMLATLLFLSSCTTTDNKTEYHKGIVLKSTLCIDDSNKTSCTYLFQILSDDLTIGSLYRMDEVNYQNVVMANIVQQGIITGDTITFSYVNRNQELTKDCCNSSFLIINMATIVVDLQDENNCE